MSLPNYSVRVSHRAKNVSLNVNTLGAIEVVVPVGYDLDRVPDLIHRKQRWLKSAVEQVASIRSQPDVPLTPSCPEQITLQAIDRTWQIEYQPVSSSLLIWREQGNNHILLKGNTQNEKLCQKALRSWLTTTAHRYLVPWLYKVSQKHQLPFQKASVRGQRTLWASCSNNQAISINYKLLFLPSPLVEYVFTHELCHTIHLNHSAKFWKLVSKYEANYQQLDKELNTAWRYVPLWAEE
ncbi:M48 family metallopeptidase [Pseudanabaena sp. PCC 6802]|uniref:M48 family metallopeptidase n=1 Tax=Pseudanabaena sp. PCC 6802 TaxID=118173 RepID=UPI0003497400|nr:SprT family zinc-dependent metalloprotease [Pseudanabaena sp. PCC 6802]